MALIAVAKERIMFSENLPQIRNDVYNGAHRLIDVITPDTKAEIDRICRAHIRRLNDLSRAVTTGERGKQRSCLFNLLNSPGSILASLLAGAPRRKRNRQLSRISWREAKDLAASIRMRQPTNFAIRLRTLTKADGGNRPIIIYSLCDRAAQKFIRDLISIILGHGQFEFARRGRGREKLIQEILTEGKGGEKWIAEADIQDCFSSFDKQELAKLIPLPQSVITSHAFISDNKKIVYNTNANISGTTVRAGLPLGSISSPIIAANMISSAFREAAVSNGKHYIDNLNICGENEKAVNSKIDALASHLAMHPAGPLRLKYVRVSKLGSGKQDCLGYRFKAVDPYYGCGYRALPTKAVILRNERRLLVELILNGTEDFETRIEKWASSWTSRYPSWRGRHNGRFIAEANATTDLVPLARWVRRALMRQKHGFGSFQELGEFLRNFVSLHLGDPDYALLEKIASVQSKPMRAVELLREAELAIERVWSQREVDLIVAKMVA